MIVGLSGKPGSGKSTVSRMVEDKVGCRRVSFGDSIRDEVEEFYGIPRELTLDDTGKESLYPVSRMQAKGRMMLVQAGVLKWTDLVRAAFLGSKGPSMTVREVLQKHATEVRRKNDPSYWVNHFMDKVADMSGMILVDDVRMKNEAEAIKCLGGKVVRLEPWVGWSPPGGSDYVTENDLDDYGAFDRRIRQRKGDSGFAAAEVTMMFTNTEGKS